MPHFRGSKIQLRNRKMAFSNELSGLQSLANVLPLPKMGIFSNT